MPALAAPHLRLGSLIATRSTAPIEAAKVTPNGVASRDFSELKPGGTRSSVVHFTRAALMIFIGGSSI